jgi:hypothetical protein
LDSLTNVLAANQFSSDVVPTVAFNLKQVKKGNVNMKIWDLGVSVSWHFEVEREIFKRIDTPGVIRVNPNFGICGTGMLAEQMP